MVDLVSLFNGGSIFVSYLMAKPSLKKNCSDTIESIAWGGRGEISVIGYLNGYVLSNY